MTIEHKAGKVSLLKAGCRRKERSRRGDGMDLHGDCFLHLPLESDGTWFRFIRFLDENQVDLWMRHATRLDDIFHRGLLCQASLHDSSRPAVAMKEVVQVPAESEGDFEHVVPS